MGHMVGMLYMALVEYMVFLLCMADAVYIAKRECMVTALRCSATYFKHYIRYIPNLPYMVKALYMARFLYMIKRLYTATALYIETMRLRRNHGYEANAKRVYEPYGVYAIYSKSNVYGIITIWHLKKHEKYKNLNARPIGIYGIAKILYMAKI